MSFTRWASVLVAAVVAFASPVFAAPSATAGAPGFASWSDTTAPTFTSPITAPETKSDRAAPAYQLCEPPPGRGGVSAAKYAPRCEVHTYFVAGEQGAPAVWAHNMCDPDFVTVYRVQPADLPLRVTLGGAFLNRLERGAGVRAAQRERRRLLRRVNSPDAAVRVKALQQAQAGRSASPFISTSFDESAMLAHAQELQALTGRRFEVLTIRGPRSGGVDFERAFAELGGRTDPGRLKDATMREFGIPDLYLPATGRSRSGFEIIERR